MWRAGRFRRHNATIVTGVPSPLPPAGSRKVAHSVDFGWPTDASVSRTMRRLSSMQYQSRPAPVTSYCHCSSGSPLTTLVLNRPLSGCCRLSRCRGSVVIRSQAVRALADAAAHTFSHPDTASAVAYRKSQPPGRGGGATRSRRDGTRYSAGRATRSPSAEIGRRNRRARRGSAWISAVARHSRRSCISSP